MGHQLRGYVPLNHEGAILLLGKIASQRMFSIMMSILDLHADYHIV